MHDFKIVAILDAHLTQGGTRHDLKVPFHRDPQRVEPEAIHHLSDTNATGHAPVLAIHSNSKAFVRVHRPRQ